MTKHTKWSARPAKFQIRLGMPSLIRVFAVCFMGSSIWSESSLGAKIIWTASSEFGTYRLCEQRRFMRACASAQSRQNLRCSLIQAVSQEEPSDRKSDPWPLWMAGHAQLKFVMTECSKTQIRLTGLIWSILSWGGSYLKTCTSDCYSSLWFEQMTSASTPFL